MFRIANWVYKPLLRRIRPRPPKYFQIGSITCFRPANAIKKYDEGGEQPMRWPCKYPITRPPPPPQPVESQTSDAWIWGSLAVLVNFSMFICWAHTSDEARDLLTLHAPWLDDIISIVYQEDMNYIQYMFCWIQKIRRYMNLLQPKPEKSCDPGKDPAPDVQQESKPEPSVKK